jgi:PTS system nitrogen regulatory IIA component
MISVKEAAEILGVTTKKVYQFIDHGLLPSHRLGKQYYLERNEVTNYMAETGKPTLEINPDEIDHELHLSEMLANAGIYYNVPGSTKTEALHNSLSLIKGIDLKVMEPIFQMFLSREELASTGVGNGIAIPHARGTLVGYINQPLLSLSFLENPIEYDAIDDKPVNILFLLISPNVQTHLRILAKLAYLLQDPACKETIINQAPPETILATIAQAEKRFGK